MMGEIARKRSLTTEIQMSPLNTEFRVLTLGKSEDEYK